MRVSTYSQPWHQEEVGWPPSTRESPGTHFVGGMRNEAKSPHLSHPGPNLGHLACSQASCRLSHLAHKIHCRNPNNNNDVDEQGRPNYGPRESSGPSNAFSSEAIQNLFHKNVKLNTIEGISGSEYMRIIVVVGSPLPGSSQEYH